MMRKEPIGLTGKGTKTLAGRLMVLKIMRSANMLRSRKGKGKGKRRSKSRMMSKVRLRNSSSGEGLWP
jgi:hypothetical protein